MKTPLAIKTRSLLSRGFTLVEVMVSTVVLAILVDAVLQASLAMAGSAEFGQKRQRLVVQLQHALEKMRQELAESSTDVDEFGNPYITVGGTMNDQTITFKRIVDFGSNGAEVQPIWSSDITYHRSAGDLVRTQDGVDERVLASVAQIDFNVLPNGRIDVTIGMIAPEDGVAPTTIIRNETVSTIY